MGPCTLHQRISHKGGLGTVRNPTRVQYHVFCATCVCWEEGAGVERRAAAGRYTGRVEKTFPGGGKRAPRNLGGGVWERGRFRPPCINLPTSQKSHCLGQGGGEMQMHFFLHFFAYPGANGFLHILHFFAFFCICFAFSLLLMSQSMDKFVSRGVANDAAANVDDTPELTDGEGDNEPDLEEPEEPEILRAGSIQCDSDLEGPSASIVVEKRLWNCSVCASVVGLHLFAFFCIYLHLFAFFCIAFFAISICISPPPPAWGGG